MVDPAMRPRVERFLRGDFRVDDLTRLFLFARDRCDGRESVQEIGDFVAHHDERTKGIVTRTVRDFYTILGVKFLPKTIDRLNLPSNFPAFLWAMSRRLNHTIVKRDTKLTRSEATKLLPNIINRLTQNSDGTLKLSAPISQKEGLILQCFCSYIIAEPAFAADRLYEDFQETLRSNGLLKKNEFNMLLIMKPAILLYATTVMHGCTIVLENGQVSNLSLGFNKSSLDPTIEDSIDILCNSEVFIGDGKKRVISTPIFQTNLRAQTYCAFGLSEFPSFETAIELTEKMKLSKI